MRANTLTMSEAQDIPTAMKHALRRFAKSVSIVTSNHDGEDYAMAATAVCELCLDPPTIMVCINRAAADGSLVGTLCLIDRRARQLAPAQLALLRDLAEVLEDLDGEHAADPSDLDEYRVGNAVAGPNGTLLVALAPWGDNGIDPSVVRLLPSGEVDASLSFEGIFTMLTPDDKDGQPARTRLYKAAPTLTPEPCHAAMLIATATTSYRLFVSPHRKHRPAHR